MSIVFDASVISFYISIIGIFSMIVYKMREIKSGKKSWLTRLANSIDHIVHDYVATIKKFISYFNRKSAVALMHWIAYHTLHFAKYIYEKVYNMLNSHVPSRRVIDMIKGRREIVKGGSSFYLRTISSDEHDKDSLNIEK